MIAYARAVELAPADERAYLGLAKLEGGAAAEHTLRALVAHVPASVDGHYQLAIRLAERDLPAAIAELRVVLELDPDQVDARLDLSRALRRAGKLDEAIANARSAFDRTGQALDVAEELFYLLCEADDLRPRPICSRCSTTIAAMSSRSRWSRASIAGSAGSTRRVR